jgi:hypothetical protein
MSRRDTTTKHKRPSTHRFDLRKERVVDAECDMVGSADASAESTSKLLAGYTPVDACPAVKAIVASGEEACCVAKNSGLGRRRVLTARVGAFELTLTAVQRSGLCCHVENKTAILCITGWIKD